MRSLLGLNMKMIIPWLITVVGLSYLFYKGYHSGDFSDLLFMLFFIGFLAILNKVAPLA